MLAGERPLCILGVRSRGLTAVSASLIRRFDLCFCLGSGVASGGLRLGSRQRHRLRSSINHVHALGGTLRHELAQHLQRRFEFFIGHRLEGIAVLYLVFAGHQQKR